MGIEVASHTYPDPGCKLPDPPDPPLTPRPITVDPDIGIEIPDTTQFFWVPVIFSTRYYNTQGSVVARSTITPSVSNKEEEEEVTATKLPFDITVAVRQPGYDEYRLSGTKNTIIHKSTLLTGGQDARTWHPEGAGADVHLFHISRSRSSVYAGFIDTGIRIKNFLTKSRENEERYLKAPDVHLFGNAYTLHYEPTDYILVGTQQKPQSFLQPGVPPHMNNDCCEDILDALDDLKEVLHVDFFRKEKFPVPSYLLAPGVDTSKTTVANNYYNLFQKLFQALAHSTIVSPKIGIKDADAVKPGDQEINSEYLSATGWAEAITKMLYEIVDDGNVGTNMDIRTGVTVTQLLVAVADLSHKTDCIIDCIGIPTKRAKGEVETSYNLVVEGDNTKGFDPKKANQKLDLNSDISTEQLLSSLLRTRKNPIVKEEIHPKAPTLFEMLQDLKNKE
jgi:hypothetical protein